MIDDQQFDEDLILRVEDRYEGELEEFLEVMQITLRELVEMFYTRVLLYQGELGVGDFDGGDTEETGLA